MDPRVLPVHPVRQAALDPREPLDSLELQAILDRTELLVPRVLRVLRVSPGPPVNLVHPEPTDNQVDRDLRVLRDQQALRDSRDQQGLTGHRDSLETRELRELTVILELWGNRDPQEHQEPLERLDPRVPVGLQDNQETRVTRDHLDPQGTPDLMVSLALTDSREQTVSPGSRVLQGSQDPRVLWAPLVLPARQEKREVLVL